MEDVFVGRQPIFDRDNKVIAYELLFRASLSAHSSASEADGSQLTASVLVGSLMDIGIDHISGNKMVYINAPYDFLTSDIASLFPPETVAIEVLEGIEVDDKVIAACTTLKERGFTILLDDFVYTPQWEPLMRIADIIKVDIIASKNLADEVESLQKHPVKLLAEKVETQEEFELTKSLGFDYFQGYFFCRPDVVSGKKIPNSKLAILQALQKAMVAEAIQDMEDVFVHDVGLSYRLLKFINSAAFGMRRQIDSIRQALALLGIKNIERWLSVLSIALLSDGKPQELVRTAMLRGRVIEETVTILNKPKPSEGFTLGLFSLLDVFLDQTMEQALKQVRLPQDVYEGLTRPDSGFGRMLHMVQAIERGNWNDVDSFCMENGLNYTSLMAVYANSMEWADEHVNSLWEA